MAKLTCAPTPPNITRVPNHMKHLNIEPHNVQAIVWWLAATLGCSVPKWPLMGVGAWGLQSVFCGKIPVLQRLAESSTALLKLSIAQHHKCMLRNVRCVLKWGWKPLC